MSPDAPESSCQPPDWLQPLDHTADAGIVVSADSLEELFARAAWGMFSIITDVPTVRNQSVERVSVTATDRDGLLLAWLSELNFRHATRHQVFGCFKIIELSEKKLIAEVSGEKIAPDRHTIYTEIKAVTFHGLQLEERDGGWRAQIIFDL